MTSCAVPGCDSDTSVTTDITFHRLPSSLAPRSRWLLALGPLPSGSYICSRHFEASMFTLQGDRRVLLPHAVPKLFGANETPDSSGHLAQSAPSSVMACRVCLATNGRLIPISGSGFEESLVAFSGVPLSLEQNLPRYLCVFCIAKLSKCVAFRDSCQRSAALLQGLLNKGPLNLHDIKTIDRNSHQLASNIARNKVFHFGTGALATPEIKTEDEYKTNFVEIEYMDDEFIKTDDVNDLVVHSLDIPIEETESVKVINERHRKVKVKAEIVSEIDCKSDAEDCVDFDSDSSQEVLVPKKTNRKRVKLKKAVKKSPKKKKDAKKKEPQIIDPETSKPIKTRNRVRNPDTDSAFDKKYNCKTMILSKEEQKREIEDRKKNSKSAYTCDVCGKGYKTECTLLTHKTYHDPKTLPFECDVCLLRFRSRRSMLKHQDGHRATFTCNECGNVSRHRTHAKDHSLMHKGTTYTCPYCQRAYNHQTSYYNHIRVQHPGQNEACDECGETFAAGRGIMLHKARAHKQYGKPNVISKCTVCSVTFLTADALRRHSELTSNAPHTAFPCPACGESFDSDAMRAQHNRERHSAAARHYCKECDKSFSNASSFALHVDRKHHDRRVLSDPSRPRPVRQGIAPSDYPCVCDICGKRYSCNATLQYHMNVHLGLKPFQCAHCPKAFPHQGQHRMHMRVHTGERPYQCKQCPMAFSRRNNFAKHVRTVHLREQVKCDKCGKQMSIASITAHVRAVHMNMPYVRKRDRSKKKLLLVAES